MSGATLRKTNTSSAPISSASRSSAVAAVALLDLARRAAEHRRLVARARRAAPRPPRGRTGCRRCRCSSLDRLGLVEAGPVRPVGDHRVIGVAGEDDPARQWDPRRRRGRPDIRRRPSARAHGGPPSRPRSMPGIWRRICSPITGWSRITRVCSAVSGVGRVEDLGRDAELADVVKRRDPGGHLDLALVEPEADADLADQARGRGRVRAGVVVAHVERRGQRQHRRLVAARRARPCGGRCRARARRSRRRPRRARSRSRARLPRLGEVGGEGAEHGAVGSLQRHRPAGAQIRGAGEIDVVAPSAGRSRCRCVTTVRPVNAAAPQLPTSGPISTPSTASRYSVGKPDRRRVTKVVALDQQNRAHLRADQARELVDDASER